MFPEQEINTFGELRRAMVSLAFPPSLRGTSSFGEGDGSGRYPHSNKVPPEEMEGSVGNAVVRREYC